MADDSPTATPSRRVSGKLIAASSLLAGIAVCGWLLPEEKPNSLLGRLSYGEFLFASGLSMTAFLILALGLVRADQRRKVGFRLTAIGLGVLAATAVGESACWFWPAETMPGNPWLTVTRDQTDRRTRQLVFERKPHLHWKGLSVGCLAVENGHDDPYACEVEFQTDHEGFRNSEDLTKADIIFLGDSHTEAGYLAEEKTFSARVGRKINLAARNLGRINHCPSEELVILEAYGLPCRPKFVVWQICEHNDLLDEVLYRTWLDAQMPEIQSPNSIRGEVWRSRSPTFRLFDFLRSRQQWPWQGEFTDADGKKHPMLFVGPLTRNHRPQASSGFPLLAQSLQKGVGLSREEKHSFQLVVLLIPEKLRVMGHFVKFSKETSKRLGPRWDLAHDQTIGFYLAKLCDQWQVPFVDMTGPLKKLAANGEMVYLPYETHLSDAGHALVADHLVEILSQSDGEPASIQ